MKVYVCIENDRWEDNYEVIKVVDTEKKAIAWVTGGEYLIASKYKNNTRSYDEYDVE